MRLMGWSMLGIEAMPRRTPIMTFIRTDNPASLRAHRKMGMDEPGNFTANEIAHVAFGYGG
jgi:hypothetical protein